MSLAFILGSAGSGKSEYAYRQTLRHAAEHPDRTHFVIVPEQFTLSTQRTLVRLSERHGIMNVEALSFERLCYRVFDELGTSVHDILEDTGKSLLLRRITDAKADELTVLQANVGKSGFIDELKSLITEFCQYDLMPSDVQTLADEEHLPAALRRKLGDIAMIYASFMEEIDNRYIVAERLLELLVDICGDSAFLSGGYFVFDGFTGFTPIQNDLMAALLAVASEIRVVVTLPKGERITGEGDPRELFYMSKRFIASLRRMASDRQVTVDDPVWMEEAGGRRFVKGGMLAHLEGHLFRGKEEAYRKEADGDAVSIVRLSDPRAELTFVAADIRRQLKGDASLHYKDMAIVCADLEQYRYYIEGIFEAYDIPVFVDAKADITGHPFVDFLLTLTELYKTDFSYEAVMRYARSAFSPLRMEEADILDNYLLATNIRGRRRFEKDFTYRMGDDAAFYSEINAIRARLIAPFAGKSEKDTVGEWVRLLYELLVFCDCEDKLAAQQMAYEDAGELRRANENEQIYPAVMGLFDKLVFLMADAKADVGEFYDMLKEGLSAIALGQLPPQADVVICGDVERTRIDQVHMVYFIGIADNAIPKKNDGGGLLTQGERAHMQTADVELAPSDRERAFMQRFYLYLVMTKPTRRLVLTYPTLNNDREALRASYLIGVVKGLFPDIREQSMTDEQLLFYEPTRAALYDDAARAMHHFAATQGAGDAAWMTWLALIKEDDATAYEKLLSGAFFTHTDTALSHAVMQGLHKGELPVSVSRLEKYAACAYAYYLAYELKLKERTKAAYDARDIGNLYHDALKLYGKKLAADQKDWTGITEEERERYITESARDVLMKLQGERSDNTARDEKMFARMTATLKRTVWALTEQVKQGAFVPNRFEVSLEELMPQQTDDKPLSDGTRLRLNGIIDRLDTYETEDAVYIKIIDYKSGQMTSDVAKMAEGLQLQLIFYMKAAADAYGRLEQKKQIIPAAFFYYHIDNPLIEEQGTPLLAETLSGQVLKALKMNGLVAGEDVVIDALDHGMGQAREEHMSYRSFAIPVDLNKSGEYGKNSAILPRDAFDTLIRFAEHKVRALSEDIMAGKMDAVPYRNTKDDTACTYCPYHSICGFEEALEGFSYRKIAAGETETVIEQMKEALREDEGHGDDTRTAGGR